MVSNQVTIKVSPRDPKFEEQMLEVFRKHCLKSVRYFLGLGTNQQSTIKYNVDILDDPKSSKPQKERARMQIEAIMYPEE